MRSGTIREAEVTEDRVEVVTVIVTDVPENRLEVTSTSRLVDGVNDLLEAVGNDFVQCTFLKTQIHHFVSAFVVILTVFLLNKVVEIHEELRRSACSGKHGTNHEDHIHETTAERFEVVRSGCITTNSFCSLEQPRIHRDRRTIVSQAGLIVFVDKVLLEQGDVLVSQFFAEHLLDTVGEQTTVETDIAGLRQFADKGSDVLLLDVSVSVVFTSCSGIRCTAVVDEEVEFFQCLTIFVVT